MQDKGSSNHFQWRRNGKIIKGATDSQYTTEPLDLSDDGDAVSVTVTSSSGQKASSDTATIEVVRKASDLQGKGWDLGTVVTDGKDSLLVVGSGIDDYGRMIVIYTRKKGTNTVVYAVHGIPAGSKAHAKWSAPVQIGTSTRQFYGSPMFSVAPNGNAFLIWDKVERCAAGSYPPADSSGMCHYVYGARYLSATKKWEQAVRITDWPGDNRLLSASPGFGAVINSRGDVAILHPSWVANSETDASGYTLHPAITWRANSSKSFKRRILVDGGEANSDYYRLRIDRSGNLLAVGILQDLNIADAYKILAYRGNVERGLGGREVLNDPTISSGLIAVEMGQGGESVVTFSRSFDSATYTEIAATTSPKSKKWTLHDLKRPSSDLFNKTALVVDDQGTAFYYDFRWCVVRRWLKNAWTPPLSLPSSDCAGSQAMVYGVARNGNYLGVTGAAANPGAWGSYDATRNRMTEVFPGKRSPGDGYVFGFKGLGGVATLFSFMHFSVSGTGAWLFGAGYATLPTASNRDGVRTSGVPNLWVKYFE